MPVVPVPVPAPEPERSPPLFVVGLAVSAAIGAMAAHRPSLWLVVATAGVVGLTRHRVRWCLLVGVAASAVSASSWAGLEAPVPAQISGWAMLITDPGESFGSVRMEIDWRGRRYQAWASHVIARDLKPRLAGEWVELSGTTRPITGPAAPYLRRRHLAARVNVESVGRWRSGSSVSRLTNGLRRTLVSGARGLPEPQRGLFAGFIYGDDRGQDDETIDNFRDAGLSHLLAVSGQNVAFILALAAPLVHRGSMGTRLAWAAAVLFVFGTLVRWEPSVTRAVIMTGIAVLAKSMGRPSSRLSILCLAVTVALVIDPLLVGSVSFLLSVTACLGIALAGPWLTERIPGPGAVKEVAGITMAAQIGVAPVLLAVFGSVPLVALPANLLAVPLAAPVMIWGVVAGLPAGLLGPPIAGWLHLPSQWLLGWVALVANSAADLGAPSLTPRSAAVLGAMVVAVVAATHRFGSHGPEARPPPLGHNPSSPSDGNRQQDSRLVLRPRRSLRNGELR